MKCRMRLAATASLLYAVSVGIAATYSSTATANMISAQSHFRPDAYQISWIGSILGLGALFGGIAAGYLCDKLGRKGALMFITLPFLAGWLLITFANSFGLVFVGRFVTGFCCGVICVVVPIYLVEISVPEVRGLLGASFQLFISLGVLLVSAFGIFLNWKQLALFGAGSITVASLFMLPMPESPRWLIVKKEGSNAAEAIKFLQGNDVDATAECLSIAHSINVENNSVFLIRDVCSPGVYKPALLSIGLVFFQQFSGSNAILFYTVSIIKQAEKTIEANEANLYIAVAMVFFTYLSTYLMDCLGRRKPLFMSGFLMFLALTALGSFLVISNDNPVMKTKFSWIPLLCLIVYIAAFSIGFGPIPWLMMAEMSPMRARSVISGMGTAICWTSAFIVTKSFISLELEIHDFSAYFMYAGFCLLSCFFTYFLPETKGKTLDEIAEYFSTEHPITSLEQPLNQEDSDIETLGDLRVGLIN